MKKDQSSSKEVYNFLRSQLIDNNIKPIIHDQKVIDAFEQVFRHEFVPENLKPYAYNDYPLSIGFNQTISQPSLVAQMLEILSLKNSDKVLEIGTGSGYQTALLSHICKKVYSIERISELALSAKEKLNKLGYKNISIIIGDGTIGLQKFAPFDAIIASAGSPKEIPQPLIDQLAIGGRLLIPAGDEFSQELILICKDKNGIKMSSKGLVNFVPLIGKYGFREFQNQIN